MISPSSNLQATAITVQTEEYEPGWNNLVPLESRIGPLPCNDVPG